MLDKKAKKMFEEVVFLVEMENTFKKPIKKIMFTEHCDENDLKGIDGWIEFNDDKISFSLRSRKLSPYYAPKDVTWTYTWKDGRPGEWHYSQEQIRIHFWSEVDEEDKISIKKCIIVNSAEMFKQRDFFEKKASIQGNTENNQRFIAIKISLLEEKRLLLYQKVEDI
jgi:hypothetical protein